MFESNIYQRAVFYACPPQVDVRAAHYNTAINLFWYRLVRGRVVRFIKGLLRYRKWLFDFDSIRSCLVVQSFYYSGIRPVVLDRIIGTEGRTDTFDIDFYPINEDSRERWVNMAILFLSYESLPPIALIQIGDAYFVRDGHHRISVACALGQTAVDAEIVAWKASPPFPWQMDTWHLPVHLTS